LILFNEFRITNIRLITKNGFVTINLGKARALQTDHREFVNAVACERKKGKGKSSTNQYKKALFTLFG
jgi:hypothetical protein